MSAYKKLLAQDVIVTPFTVNKQFSFSGVVPRYNENGPFLVDGKNNTYLTGSTTGSLPLVFNSIKQLYYSNYLDNTGKVYDSGTGSFTPSYLNSIQSISELRYFPTKSDAYISVLSIPTKQFGDYIKPKSFSSLTTYDDGEGNLIANSFYGIGDGEIVGNIIYDAGLVIHVGVTGSGAKLSFRDLEWESSYTIYETQYKCTISADEFNYSLNPSLISSSAPILSGSTQYVDFVTGSDFSPYVTTVGLYNDNQELLAVAKLAQPLPTSQTTDTTILINLDR